MAKRKARTRAPQPEPASVPARRITIRLDIELPGADAELTVEGGPGVNVIRQEDGSWRVELS